MPQQQPKNTLSSRERVLRTIAGEPVDRIPIWSPIDWNPLVSEPESSSWKAQPYYQDVVRVASQYCDFLIHIGIPEESSVEASSCTIISIGTFGF